MFVSMPPAIVMQAVGACNRQTWFHPEAYGHGASSFGRSTVVVECSRSESNVTVVNSITVYMRGQELSDAVELNAIEEKVCWPFRGTACSVEAL
jgi:hypothetical protein